MILLPLIVFGALLAKILPPGIGSALLIILGHYFLDTLPHWEYVDSAEELKRVKVVIFFDLFSGLILAYFFIGFSWWVALAIFLSLSPDLPILLMAFCKSNRFLRAYFSLNDFFHFCYPTAKAAGILMQILVVVSSIIVSAFLK